MTDKVSEDANKPAQGELWRAGLAALGAKHVIEYVKEDGAAEVALARVVASTLKRVRIALVPPGFEEEDSGTPEEGELHSRDAAAVAFLRELGSPTSKLRECADKTAEKWAEKATKKWQARNQLSLTGLSGEKEWEEWSDSESWQLNFARYLATALWEGQVAAEIQHQRDLQKQGQPGLAYAVHARVVEVFRPNLTIGEYNGQRMLFDSKGAPTGTALARVEPLKVPAIELETAQMLLPRGVQLLGSVRAHRLLRFEVMTGHRQYLEKNPDSRVVRVDGGWEALPEAIGLKPSSQAVEECRRIIVAQAHLCYEWPDGSRGNMLSYMVRSAAGQRRGQISLVLGDALMPQFVFTLPSRTQGQRDRRRLVPIVNLPPFVGSPSTHGAQASFQLAILGEMRRRAVELVADGGVVFTEEDLARIAAEVGLASGLVARVVDRWTNDGDDGPAFLERINGRLTLAKEYESALELIREGGERERRGGVAGRRSARRRNSRAKTITE